jgi:hypothetical protein
VNAARAIAILEQEGLPLVTTSEAAALWGISARAANEMLRRIAAAGVLHHVRRGLWGRGAIDPLRAVERVAEPDVAYVSLLTALRLRGMVEQIAPATQAVTTGRARTIHTPIGSFELHHVAPEFCRGFDRDLGFPLATPEKALVDVLYLSATRDRTLSRLPELELPRAFSIHRARRWVQEIPDERARARVAKRLESALE